MATEEVTQTVQEQEEDPTLVVGQVLTRAKKVVFDLPNAIAGQRKAAREAGQATPEYRKLQQQRSVIKASSAVIFGEDASDEAVLTAVQALRQSTAKATELKESVKAAGQEHLDRASELTAELKLEKEELGKDFASEIIKGLMA